MEISYLNAENEKLQCQNQQSEEKQTFEKERKYVDENANMGDIEEQLEDDNIVDEENKPITKNQGKSKEIKKMKTAITSSSINNLNNSKDSDNSKESKKSIGSKDKDIQRRKNGKSSSKKEDVTHLIEKLESENTHYQKKVNELISSNINLKSDNEKIREEFMKCLLSPDAKSEEANANNSVANEKIILKELRDFSLNQDEIKNFNLSNIKLIKELELVIKEQSLQIQTLSTYKESLEIVEQELIQSFNKLKDDKVEEILALKKQNEK